MAVLSVYFDCRASRPKSSETSTIPISTRRFLARASWVVAGTRGLDFAIATCRDNRGIQTGFDQIIAHGASAALRQIAVVIVGANVVGVSIDVDGVSLGGKKDPSDATQEFAILRTQRGAVEVELNGILSKIHHKTKRRPSSLDQRTQRFLQAIQILLPLLADLFRFRESRARLFSRCLRLG